MPKDNLKIKNKYFEFPNSFKQLNLDLTYAGIFLGEDFQDKFKPSLYFLESVKDKFGEIILNKKNSWLFTCNRIITDVVKDSKTGYLVIVKNAYNEVLGIAKRSHNKFIPIYDVGFMLRKEINKFEN